MNEMKHFQQNNESDSNPSLHEQSGLITEQMNIIMSLLHDIKNQTLKDLKDAAFIHQKELHNFLHRDISPLLKEIDKSSSDYQEYQELRKPYAIKVVTKRLRRLQSEIKHVKNEVQTQLGESGVLVENMKSQLVDVDESLTMSEDNVSLLKIHFEDILADPTSKFSSVLTSYVQEVEDVEELKEPINKIVKKLDKDIEFGVSYLLKLDKVIEKINTFS